LDTVDEQEPRSTRALVEGATATDAAIGSVGHPALACREPRDPPHPSGPRRTSPGRGRGLLAGLATATIDEHTGPTGIAALRSAWTSLTSRLVSGSFTQSFHWYHAYARHLCPRPDRLRVFTLTREGRVTAILPLELRSVRVRKMGFRAWCLPDVDHVPLRSVIVAPEENGAEALAAFVAHLTQRPGGPGLLVLGGMSRKFSEMISAGPLRGRLESRPARACDIIRTSRPYAQVLASLSKNFRGNLRKARNKLAQMPGVEFRVASGSEMGPAVREFIRVESLGWKGAGGTGTALGLHPGASAFYTALGEEHESAQVGSLWVGGICIAAQLRIRTGHELAVLKIGYDERFARLAPGQLLLEETIRSCCASADIHELNLVTDTAWHADWRPERRELATIYISLGGVGGKTALSLLRSRVAATLSSSLTRLRRGPGGLRDAGTAAAIESSRQDGVAAVVAHLPKP
jgi:hypothetical protein